MPALALALSLCAKGAIPLAGAHHDAGRIHAGTGWNVRLQETQGR